MRRGTYRRGAASWPSLSKRIEFAGDVQRSLWAGDGSANGSNGDRSPGGGWALAGPAWFICHKSRVFTAILWSESIEARAGIMGIMPPLIVPPQMPLEVEKLLDAIGGKSNTEVLHQLAISPKTTAELVVAIGSSERSRVHRILQVLESAGLVSADVPPELRKGRGSRLTWSTNVDAVERAGDLWLSYATGRDGLRDGGDPQV